MRDEHKQRLRAFGFGRIVPMDRSYPASDTALSRSAHSSTIAVPAASELLVRMASGLARAPFSSVPKTACTQPPALPDELFGRLGQIAASRSPSLFPDFVEGICLPVKRQSSFAAAQTCGFIESRRLHRSSRCSRAEVARAVELIFTEKEQWPPAGANRAREAGAMERRI